ncbi:hypothetical protein [Thiohalorhabdus methylotrophus]|uniref:Uncharacterized protein n=1 Tax=Thiohalorhabdus methylotrophus TaxID=3242694 RepID=A0ABV4TTU1_9GAMM
MSLLAVAHSDSPLALVCQTVGLFLRHRWARQREGPAQEPLLGVWLDPSPLDTVSALSLGGDGSCHGEPRIRESCGLEGAWYVCWLAADPGPQGEIETLTGLLDLLLERGGPGGDRSGQAFAPCFGSATPAPEIGTLLGRLAVQFPDTLTGAITQDPDDGCLTPQPDLGIIRPS